MAAEHLSLASSLKMQRIRAYKNYKSKPFRAVLDGPRPREFALPDYTEVVTRITCWRGRRTREHPHNLYIIVYIQSDDVSFTFCLMMLHLACSETSNI